MPCAPSPLISPPTAPASWFGSAGAPRGVRVVSANSVQDRDALRALAPDLAAHGSVLLVWLDRGFAGDDPAAFLRGYGIIPELVGTPGRRGFQVEPRRWKVEQTFGCLQRHRRPPGAGAGRPRH